MSNPQLENGYTRIANEIIDALCKFRMPGECIQVLNCVFRKTYGYQKKEDWVSNSQIVEMTGLKKGNASRALSKLITNKIVIKTDNKLKLNKNYKEWVSFKSLSKVITGKKNKVVIQSATAVIQSDNKSLSKVRDTKEKKETITKEIPAKQAISNNKDLTEVGSLLEETLKTKIVNWGKQAKALSNMLKAGYTKEQIKKVIIHMATKDDFFSDKGFDLVTVSNQISRYKAEEVKRHG